uniref:Uncharacterized protein n=1 Tax=Aegilops tauschii subsp. strangulata TaxID=200361 RepID=A0A453CYB6_AEGTS
PTAQVAGSQDLTSRAHPMLVVPCISLSPHPHSRAERRHRPRSLAAASSGDWIRIPRPQNL